MCLAMRHAELSTFFLRTTEEWVQNISKGEVTLITKS